MIVTIDGPAGAGKSSVARELARRLGFVFLDTGAMYRAVALAAIERGLDLADERGLAELAAQLDIVWGEGHLLLDGRDVTTQIRTSAITSATRYSANNPGVRGVLVESQRAFARGKNVVTEGRDQGTVVFPDAACKIFLTASPAERARRRAIDLAKRGEEKTVEEVLADQNKRDEGDANRSVGPLVRATDAIEVLTDGLELPDVIAKLEALVRSRM
jgi:cytidylate kinase